MVYADPAERIAMNEEALRLAEAARDKRLAGPRSRWHGGILFVAKAFVSSAPLRHPRGVPIYPIISSFAN
jgi:hypothetical protein